MSPGMAASRKYLDPEIVARLRGLELRARSVTAGSVSGMHRSAYHGFSVEFAEHRQYVPGDDIRYMDWRIFGRADRLYIKQYEEETNLYCNLLVDASRSMAYPTAGTSSRAASPANGRSKYDYAAALAANLAYVLINQQDSAGLVTFDSEVRRKETGFLLSFFKKEPRHIQHRVGRFRQVNLDNPCTHHDAIEFPDGQIVLLTHLCVGQHATVLQLPADQTAKAPAVSRATTSHGASARV